MRVLVVEDEEGLAEVIARRLRRDGLAVDLAHDGRTALAKAMVVDYDAVVLDRDLPEVHGDEVCVRLVASERPPRILMLTASGDVGDRISGLDLGADDYLPKPFSPGELTARLRALQRRPAAAQPPVLRRHDVELDPARRTVARGGRLVELGRKEFGLLEALLRAGEALLRSRTPATWDEAELLEVSMTSATGTRDAEALGVRPQRLAAVLGVGG